MPSGEGGPEGTPHDAVSHTDPHPLPAAVPRKHAAMDSRPDIKQLVPPCRQGGNPACHLTSRSPNRVMGSPSWRSIFRTSASLVGTTVAFILRRSSISRISSCCFRACSALACGAAGRRRAEAWGWRTAAGREETCTQLQQLSVPTPTTSPAVHCTAWLVVQAAAPLEAPAPPHPWFAGRCCLPQCLQHSARAAAE